MKRKNPGISLLVAFGVSFLVLGIAISVITSINRAVERGALLGRTNQIFFAAESGLEAAFFHHNARGQGVEFSGDQVIAHPDTSASVVWQIDGRDEELSGLLRERQKIQIPLFWDGSINPSEEPPFDGDGNFEPTHLNADKLSDPFEIIFTMSDDIPTDFDFGVEDDAVLIDWSVSRENDPAGPQTFVPRRGDDGTPCGTDTEFICRNDFLNSSDISIVSDTDLEGKILPGGYQSSLVNFIGDSNSEKFTFSFQPLLPFENIDQDEKIEGIPFSLESTGSDSVSFPRESYIITAEVSIGDFSKTITTEVPEKTTIGAFDYVIFD